MNATANYHDDLIRYLGNPEDALHYLNAALEDDDKSLFLRALRDIAQAQGGLSKVARLAKLNRVNLYRMLSERGNPEFDGLNRLVKALGYRLAIEPSGAPANRTQGAGLVADRVRLRRRASRAPSAR